MSDPDPCCVHEHQLDAAVRDLARAHGRPEGAERIARGLPPTTTKARHEHVAGLTTAQKGAPAHGEQCCGCINRAPVLNPNDHHPRPHAWTGTRPQEHCPGCGGVRYWTGLNDTQEPQ